jgi:MFS family permease
MVGAPFAAVLSDRYGRRKGMFVGGATIILGMIIAATSKHIAQLVVGRFVLGFGIAIMTVAAPAYSIEIAPPHWRGRCTGEWRVYRSSPPLHVALAFPVSFG